MFPICCAVYKEKLPIESYSYEEFCILSSFAKLQLCIEAANQFPFFLWFVHPACSSHAALLNPKSNCCQPHLPVRHPFCRSDSPSLRFTFGKIGIPSAVCCSRTKNPFILETILLREMLQDYSIFWKFGRMYNFNFKFLCKTAMRSALFLAIQEIFQKSIPFSGNMWYNNVSDCAVLLSEHRLPFPTLL